MKKGKFKNTDEPIDVSINKGWKIAESITPETDGISSGQIHSSAMFQRILSWKTVWLRIVILAFIMLIIITGGWLYFKVQRAYALSKAQEVLVNIADLKVGQIANWMKERRADVEISLSKRLVREFLSEPENPLLREELLQWITSMQRIYDYRALILFNAHAKVLLSAISDSLMHDACIVENVMSALHSNEIVFTDLYIAQADKSVHMSFMVPFSIKPKINSTNPPQADGVLVFIIDPNRFFYPLVQSWPKPSLTLESLLIRREGNEVVYLNELRHRANTALKLRLPIDSNSNLPALVAIQGYEGIVEGVDYRGIQVLAVTRKIPGTPWFMVVKQDKEEIYAPLRQQAWIISLITILLLLSILLGSILVWRRQKLVLIMKNLVERKRIEDELRQTHNFLENLLDCANAPIIVWDKQYRIIRFNHAFERLTGRSATEAIGLELDWLFPEDSRQSSLEKIHTASAGERWETLEIDIQHFDRSVRTLLWNSATLLSPDGKEVMATIAQGQDITGRKRAEEAQRESEEKYRNLIATMMNAFSLHEMIFDDKDEPTDYKFLEVNPAWEKIVGIKAETVIGKRVKEIMPAIEDNWIQLYGRVVKTGIPEEFEDYNSSTKKYYHVYAYCPSTGKFAVFFNDITARKQDEETMRKNLDLAERSRKAMLSAYEDLKRAKDALRILNTELEIRIRERTAQLEASNKELEAFSYSVSHDLRAPLRAIDGFGKILEEDYSNRLDEEGLRLLGIISSETKRMGQLIDDLLAFSRLGRQALEAANIDMTALAGSVFKELASYTPKRALQFECKALPSAQGDPAMLRVVLTNLLSNAIKFTMPRNPAVIEVGSIQEDKQTIYFVKDNGVGFNMKYVNKLFGVFQRLHSNNEFEGTGVGLSMVQRIIKRHGGRIWAESKINEGTTFFFTIINAKE